MYAYKYSILKTGLILFHGPIDTSKISVSQLFAIKALTCHI